MNYITFTMPKPSASVACWIEFFTEVMQVDPTAPMHILMAHYKFVYDLQITLPPTPHQDVYQDVGIVMSADDERSANEAAIQSGIYAKGVAQLVDSANTENPYFNECVSVLDAILDAFSGDAFGVDGDVLSKIRALFDGDRKRLQVTKDYHLPACDNKQEWIAYLEHEMEKSSRAIMYIFDYLLQQMSDTVESAYCLPGNDRYCAISEKMYKNVTVLDAAIQCGLMAGAVSVYFDIALRDVYSWCMMESGIRFVLQCEKLNIFIPFALRFVAGKLLDMFPNGIDDEDAVEEWDKANQQLWSSLMRGAPYKN